MLHKRKRTKGATVFHSFLVVAGAVLCTLTFFLVLPVIQAINAKPAPKAAPPKADIGELPTPDAPPEEEEPEPEEPEQQEDLMEEQQLLDLAQLEMALGTDVGGGWGGSGFGAIELPSLTAGNGADDAAFAFGGVDQDARPKFRQEPQITPAIRRQGKGTVWLAFLVDENGNVQRPRVVSSPHPAYVDPALKAIRKWKFEPARSNGKPVASPMKIPITFNPK